MEYIGALGMLGFNALTDWKRKEISVMATCAFGILGIVLHLIFRSVEFKEMLLGMAFGGGIFIVSYLTKEQIGKGDAFLLTILGLYIGAQQVIAVFVVAIFLASIVAIILRVVKKKEKDFELPFAPFIFCGYLVYMFINLVI